jgi:hypothetical protein
MTLRKAIIRDGYVNNIIVIEHGSAWECPEGCSIIDAGKDAEVGVAFENGKFIKDKLSPRAMKRMNRHDTSDADARDKKKKEAVSKLEALGITVEELRAALS